MRLMLRKNRRRSCVYISLLEFSVTALMVLMLVVSVLVLSICVLCGCGGEWNG